MAYVHRTWLTGAAASAEVRQHNGVINVDLGDNVVVSAVQGDSADELGRTLITLGRQVLALNGTDQDDLALNEFVEQEDVPTDLVPVLRHFRTYLDSVRAKALNELVLAEVDQ